jgi:DNA-binding NarL/FixJ family response regulator
MNTAPSILIAEDDDDSRILIKTMLNSLEFPIVGYACDGDEAVKKVAALKPDVLLLNIGLPVLNGLEVARRILAEIWLPIVVFTGRSDNETLKRASAIGVHAFLLKPLSTKQQLRAAIFIALDICDRQREDATEISRLQSMLQLNLSESERHTLERRGLTRRESDVVHLLAKGRTNFEIGTVLGISCRTAEKHVEHVKTKLGVKSRTAAARLVVDAIRRRAPSV